MIGLLQRVTAASVRVEDEVIARCDAGLLVLVGVSTSDTTANAERLAARILGYRVFADGAGKMNRSLVDAGGGLIVVPQFTLASDTDSGRRPSFTSAAPPETAEALFKHLLGCLRANYSKLQSGRFGADMQVALVNDGPVTFWLEA